MTDVRFLFWWAAYIKSKNNKSRQQQSTSRTIMIHNHVKLSLPDFLLVVASAVPQGRGVIKLQDVAVFVSRVATPRASVPVPFKDALALARRVAAA